MIGGDEGLLTSYDVSTHTLIDVLNVGTKITAIACTSTTETEFITCIGTGNGSLMFRNDWD